MLLNKLTDIVHIVPEVRQSLCRQRTLLSCRMTILATVMPVFHNAKPVITKSVR